MNGKTLNVPFFPQTDNKYNPHGACNVTSIAMALSFLGIKGDGSEKQLEDQLYQWLLKKGLSRHSPYDLAKLVESKGKKDNFNPIANFTQIKKHIDAGFPVVIHGFFTRSGHIIECHGYNEIGLICHDPYGDWEDGYLGSVNNGKNVLYTYHLIKQLCNPDNEFWVHFIQH